MSLTFSRPRKLLPFCGRDTQSPRGRLSGVVSYGKHSRSQADVRFDIDSAAVGHTERTLQTRSSEYQSNLHMLTPHLPDR
jgi:hypothetical protein